MEKLTTYVVGSGYHHGAMERLRTLRAGAPLTLKAEPENAYDRYAVEVFYRTQKLGYIPRTDSRRVAGILKRGAVKEVKLAFSGGNTVMIAWISDAEKAEDAQRRRIQREIEEENDNDALWGDT